MNNLESINLTYKYLSEVYDLTKLDYVRRKLIKSGELRGLNPKSLIKHNLLIEQDEKYKWKGLIPQYFHAYDYYNAVRGKKKTYENLLTILKYSENYEIDEIMEALAIKGACVLHGLENSEIVTKYENEVINLSDFKLHKAINESTEGSLMGRLNTPDINDHIKLNDDPVDLTQFDKLVNIETTKNNLTVIERLKMAEIEQNNELNAEMLKSISDKFGIFLNDIGVIKELLGDLIENTMENTTSVKNNHNSISTIIAILKTNQDNLFDISASQYYIIRELYATLIEEQSDDPKHKDRVEKIGVALQQMRKRVDNNVAIINKYGNGKR
jgi:hypothetical protein